ncbi:MAG: hypothetical protein IT342_04730 [Candidatus Melainabacteria bacterium]|nr:hypothetical protein [Candidatus Melainabacteria bacterium]
MTLQLVRGCPSLLRLSCIFFNSTEIKAKSVRHCLKRGSEHLGNAAEIGCFAAIIKDWRVAVYKGLA